MLIQKSPGFPSHPQESPHKKVDHHLLDPESVAAMMAPPGHHEMEGETHHEEADHPNLHDVASERAEVPGSVWPTLLIESLVGSECRTRS